MLVRGGELYINSTSDFRLQHVSNNVYVDNLVSGNYYFRTSGYLSRLTILNGGNVGIGTTSPSHDLHIHNSNNAYIQLTSGSSMGTGGADGFQIISVGSTKDIVLSQRESANMRFDTNNDEKMRIDSNGRVGIGRDGNINTACRLHVAPGSGGGGISIVYIEHGDYVFNNTTSSASNTSIVAEDDVVVGGAIGSVSYTHLTLPTTPYV